MNASQNSKFRPSKTGGGAKSQAETDANETRWKKHEEILALSKLFTVQITGGEIPAQKSSCSDTIFADQKEESEKYASLLLEANKQLIFQSLQGDKLVSKLLIADKEILFQNKEKEQRRAESDRHDHLYAFANNVNQLILHVKDEARLFHNACTSAVEFGEFRMAWVGLFGHANSTITNAEYLNLNGEELHRCEVRLKTNSPQALVLQTGAHYVCNNIMNNAKLSSWKPLAMQRDIASCLILPIKKGGIVIGTLNLYSGHVNFFDTAAIDILTGISASISFTLDGIEDRKNLKLAEATLRRNETLFRKLIEKQKDMIVLSTVIGKLLYVSPIINEVLGYTIEEFQEQSLPVFIHPEEIKVFMENRDIISRNPGATFNYKQRLLHKNGSWVWCEGTDVNRLNEAGINAIVSNFHEISETGTITGGLENNNLDALINSTTDLIWSVDKNFNLITANQPFNGAVAMAFGKSIKKGESAISTLYPAKQLKQYKTYYKRAFVGETFTEVIYFDNPAELWSEISFSPILNGEEIIGAACHSRDITAHKKAEEVLLQTKLNLAQSESRLKEAQAIAQIGNFESDLTNKPDIWSDEMYKISGIEKGEFEPSYELFFSLIHPDDLNDTKTAFDQCAMTFQNNSFDFRFIHKNGDIKYGHTEVRFEFDSEGVFTRMFGIFQDVTQLKLAEIDRKKLVTDLTLRNAELEQFGYIVSHNLRAPIANIIGATTALSDPSLDNKDKEILNIGLTVSALKLDDVVKDLNIILEIKKEIGDPKELVQLSEVADDVKKNVQTSINEPGVEIKYDFSEANELFTLKGYLRNIFYQLISNSIKYSRKHTRAVIEIKSRIVKNKMVLLFKDNGLGINLRKCGDKVFGLYNRFHTNIKGKGMGLFIVKTQVEALGGKISMKSQENEGTEVKIEFEV